MPPIPPWLRLLLVIIGFGTLFILAVTCPAWWQFLVEDDVPVGILDWRLV
jgi:hypothetical protein